MSDANDIQVLLKPSRKVAKHTVSIVVTVCVVGIPLLWLFNRDDDDGDSTGTLLLLWGAIAAIWIGGLLVHYWVLLRDEHGLLFARGDTIYERTGFLMLWRRSKKLIECGPGHAMTIELAETYQRNERTYEFGRPSERVAIRLSNGTQTAEIRPKRHDVEDGWNDAFHRRFAEWQESIGAEAPRAMPEAAPESVTSMTSSGGSVNTAEGTIYPLLKPNADRIKHHMFWATVRWIGGFLLTWLLVFVALISISDSTAMLNFGLIGVPTILAIGTFLVLRRYHRIGHDSMPMLYGTDAGLYRRAGGMWKPRYSTMMLPLSPGQPMVIKQISRLGLRDYDDDRFRSWWNLRARITLSSGAHSATWRSPLFLVEDNWQVRFKRRFNAWQDAVAPDAEPSRTTETSANV